MTYKQNVREFLGWILRILREHGYDRAEAKSLVRKSGIVDILARDPKTASYIMHRDVDDWCDRILAKKGKRLFRMATA